MDGGDRLTQVFAGLLLCGVAYVVICAFLAAGRGEDTRQAAVGAYARLKPGLFVGAVGLVAFLIFAAVSTVVVILALLSLLTGDDDYDAAALAVLVGGTVVLIAVVVGGLWWGIARLRRTAAARPRSSRDPRG